MKDIQLRESKDISHGDFSPAPGSNKNQSADRLAEVIYQAYPRKVARGAAIRAIKSELKTHPAEFLLERVQAYAAAIGWKDRQFIPYPATWFNGQRFNDDPAEWAQPAPAPTRQEVNHRADKAAREYPEPPRRRLPRL